MSITIDENPLTLPEIESVAFGDAPVELADSLESDIQAAASTIKKCAENDKPIYGVTTGFGANRDVKISLDDADQLQRRLIMSHASGVGEPLDRAVVRIMMLLRVKALSFGYSGIRLQTLQQLIDLLNEKIHPRIPKIGSVGASGDLCPLAHMALPLLGEGKVEYEGTIVNAGDILEQKSIEPIEFTFKEGLALLNGTQGMTALGLATVIKFQKYLDIADLLGAMSLEAVGGRLEALDKRIHAIRGHQGQIETAKNMRAYLEGSQLAGIEEGRIDGKSEYVQDSYSIRCIPQVHGASRSASLHVKDVLLNEANAVTDNPLIFQEDSVDDFEGVDILSGGNFHGQPVALAMDYLKTAIAEIGNISERRTNKLLDKHHSEGLPPFLTSNSGLNSGLMVPQYVAASLVSENKNRATPASVDSIPTSANAEDHVSMGMHSANQAYEMVNTTAKILGIEYLTVSQALDFRDEFQLADTTEQARKLLRTRVDFLDEDRVLENDLQAATDLIKEEHLHKIATAAQVDY